MSPDSPDLWCLFVLFFYKRRSYPFVLFSQLVLICGELERFCGTEYNAESVFGIFICFWCPEVWTSEGVVESLFVQLCMSFGFSPTMCENGVVVFRLALRFQVVQYFGPELVTRISKDLSILFFTICDD